jgi:hypothetical protein
MAVLECDADWIIDRIIQVHLAAWTVACVVAFLAYYLQPDMRHNPRFNGQLQTLSGLMVHDKPLFGTLMCGFGGAVVVAVVGRITETCDWVAMLLLIVLFSSLLAVVNYDVHDFRTAHFASLAVLATFGTCFVTRVDVHPPYIRYCFYIATGVFGFMIAFNTFYMRWTPPFMTLQAMTEIVWAFSLCACVLAFALEE